MQQRNQATVSTPFPFSASMLLWYVGLGDFSEDGFSAVQHIARVLLRSVVLLLQVSLCGFVVLCGDGQDEPYVAVDWT